MGYYAGDPGFFSIVKSIGSAAAGMIPGVGGLVGRAISKIPAPIRGGAMRVGTTIAKHPVLSAAGAAGAIATGGSVAAGRGGGFGHRPRQHPSPSRLRALAMCVPAASPPVDRIQV